MSQSKVVERQVMKFEVTDIANPIEDWLSARAPGYDQLSPTERALLKDFSMLWSLLESKCLGCSANANTIVGKCTEWHSAIDVDLSRIAGHLEYFQDRYVSDGETNDRFAALHLRANDHPELVKSVLVGEPADLDQIAAAILIVIFRYRNNFFHGTKWAYGFKAQEENFQIANRVLMQSVEIGSSD